MKKSKKYLCLILCIFGVLIFSNCFEDPLSDPCPGQKCCEVQRGVPGSYTGWKRECRDSCPSPPTLGEVNKSLCE